MLSGESAKRCYYYIITLYTEVCTWKIRNYISVFYLSKTTRNNDLRVRRNHHTKDKHQTSYCTILYYTVLSTLLKHKTSSSDPDFSGSSILYCTVVLLYYCTDNKKKFLHHVPAVRSLKRKANGDGP